MFYVINNCFGGFSLNQRTADTLGVKRLDDSKAVRTNSDLIAMIQRGEDVNGPFADLAVVEIPDDATDFMVQEYDGAESLLYAQNGRICYAEVEEYEDEGAMTNAENIVKALEYALEHGCTKEAKNDAANIYANSLEEYYVIWEHLNEMEN